jgi:hypothetical protein
MRLELSSLARVAGILALLSIALFSAVGPGTAAEITYIYDSLGRLRAVVDDPAVTNEVAIYSYDAVGNLTSIGRQSADIVSIIEVTPEGGPEGATVTIAGTGFSSTASQNSVSFNGTNATVVSASRTRLIATVPTSATSGTITVTAPNGVAGSPTAFSVGTPGGPTITGFSPSIAASGAAVTITGTNFDALANNSLFFNTDVRRGTVATATATQLVASVPSAVGSGRLTVATPQGQVVSTADFFVAPPPFLGADVQVTGRMVIGDNRTVTTTTAGKIGLLVFDGSAGQYVSLGVPSGIGANVSMLNPDGSTLVTTRPAGDVNAQLTRTGTYTILVDPDGANTGTVTLVLTAPVTGTITTADPPLAVTLQSGQVIRKTFTGTAGEWKTFAVSSVSSSLSPSCNSWDAAITLAILKPDGTTLATTTATQCGNRVNVQLPVTGTYTAYVDVALGRSGTLTVTLSNPVDGPIATTDAPLGLTLRPGQGVRKPFSGTAGEFKTFAVSGPSSSLSPSCNSWDAAITLAILKPDGTTLATTTATQCGNRVNVQLPVTGTYTAYVDVAFARSGTLTVTLSDPVGGPIATIDNPQTHNLRPGQGLRQSFTGTAAAWVNFAVGNVSSSLSPSCNSWDAAITLAILKPDGTTLSSTTSTRCGADLDAQLPLAGTYTAYIDIAFARSGSLTVTLSDPVGGEITPADAPLPVTIRPGQDIRKFFTGTAGQWIGIGISSVGSSLSPTCNSWDTFIHASLLKPDGTTLTTVNLNLCGGNIEVQLPVSGTYTVVVDVDQARAGTLTITVSEAISGMMTTSDPPLTVIIRPGQDVRKTFSGTAGEWKSLGISGVSPAISPSCNSWDRFITASVLKPDGTTLTSVALNLCGGDLDFSVPVTGEYTFVVDVGQGRSGSYTVTLSDAIADAIATTDPPVVVTIRPGQDVRKTFSGTAGQSVNLAITNIGTSISPSCYSWESYIAMAIVKPDGTTLVSGNFSLCGGSLSAPLPVTGTYTVYVDVAQGRSGSYTLTLSGP